MRRSAPSSACCRTTGFISAATPVQTITNNDAIVCEGIPVDIDYVTPTENGDITLTASYPVGVTGSVNYTGQSIGAAGTITETLDNTTSSPQIVTYTFTTDANGCAPAVTSVNVTVDPTPTFTGTPYSRTICSGQALGFNPTSDVTGAVYTWTSAPVANITGNTATGSGTITDVLINTGDAVETVIYVLTVTGP